MAKSKIKKTMNAKARASRAQAARNRSAKSAQSPTVRKIIVKDNKLSIESPMKRGRGRPRSMLPSADSMVQPGMDLPAPVGALHECAAGRRANEQDA